MQAPFAFRAYIPSVCLIGDGAATLRERVGISKTNLPISRLTSSILFPHRRLMLHMAASQYVSVNRLEHGRGTFVFGSESVSLANEKEETTYLRSQGCLHV